MLLAGTDRVSHGKRQRLDLMGWGSPHACFVVVSLPGIFKPVRPLREPSFEDTSSHHRSLSRHCFYPMLFGWLQAGICEWRMGPRELSPQRAMLLQRETLRVEAQQLEQQAQAMQAAKAAAAARSVASPATARGEASSQQELHHRPSWTSPMLPYTPDQVRVARLFLSLSLSRSKSGTSVTWS